MSKKTKKRSGVGRARKVVDLQLKEFEEKDLGDDIRLSGVRVVHISPKTHPTSILLGAALVAQLKKAAAKRGIGYQTMLKLIAHENIKKYLS